MKLERSKANRAGSGELATIRSRIKKVAVFLGLNIADYSGHSLRAGDASDLFYKRVPCYLIKKMGRWKSDAALLYYRSDEDVYEAVRKAFKELAGLGEGDVKNEPTHYWKGCLFP